MHVVAVASARWSIEKCVPAAKNKAGLASYQVHDHTSRYRHITLAMLAHGYRFTPRATAEKEKPEPWMSS